MEEKRSGWDPSLAGELEEERDITGLGILSNEQGVQASLLGNQHWGLALGR